MNLSAIVYKPNRQHIPPFRHNPSRYAWRKPASKHTPPFRHNPSRYAWRKPASKQHPTLRHNRPQRLWPVGKPIHKQTSPRPKRRSTAQTSQTQDAAGKASPKPTSPKTPSAKRRSNPQDRPTNPPPQAHRQKAPKIKMGSGPDPDPIGSFQSDAAQLRLLFTATSMFSWQRPLFAVDILDQP